MTPLQLELTRLIGKKELTFGCLVMCKSGLGFICSKRYVCDEYVVSIDGKDVKHHHKLMEIIGHPATLSDFHRWIITRKGVFTHQITAIYIGDTRIPYDSSKDLLDQEESTMEQIIELIKSNQ